MHVNDLKGLPLNTIMQTLVSCNIELFAITDELKALGNLYFRLVISFYIVAQLPVLLIGGTQLILSIKELNSHEKYWDNVEEL